MQNEKSLHNISFLYEDKNRFTTFQKFFTRIKELQAKVETMEAEESDYQSLANSFDENCLRNFDIYVFYDIENLIYDLAITEWTFVNCEAITEHQAYLETEWGYGNMLPIIALIVIWDFQILSIPKEELAMYIDELLLQ